MRRRDLVRTIAGLAIAPRFTAESTAQESRPAAAGLPLTTYQPKSMLRVKETRVERAAFPLIDFHTHLTEGDGIGGQERITFAAKPEEVLLIMERRNIRAMVNLTGGYGQGLEECVRVLHTPHPDRFLVFTEPWWSKTSELSYPAFQAGQIERAHQRGARGIKVLKTLGLYLREKGTTGALVKIDDPRFDPMWETAGALKMPVAIHISDPLAFFTPVDRFNERYEELHAHPDWSFYGADWPSDRELQEARRRVMRRHPRTQFVCLHLAVSEDLGYVSQCLDEHPNMLVEFAARIGELGRQPRAAAKFFDRYQDRVLFGTDATPNGYEFPQQLFGDDLYQIYFRFLETDDEYFDYAPAPIPPQGRWRISGLALPEQILRKIYYQNAARLLGLPEERS
jgi:predicted TIM-barrel fold metal-dependent hydrolase